MSSPKELFVGLTADQVAFIENPPEGFTVKMIAEKLEISERSIYRYRAEMRAKRREDVSSTVTEHVKDRLPNDLRLLDKIMNTAEKEMTQGTAQAPQWAKTALQCLTLRFGFLGFPGKTAKDFEGKSDKELSEMIREELGKRNADGTVKTPDAEPIPFFVMKGGK